MISCWSKHVGVLLSVFNVWHFKLMFYYIELYLLDHYTQWIKMQGDTVKFISDLYFVRWEDFVELWRDQLEGCRDGVVSVATGWTLNVSVPGRGKLFLSSPKRPDRHKGPLSSCSMGRRGKATASWRWSFTSMWWQSYEWVELYFHSRSMSLWRVKGFHFFLALRRIILRWIFRKWEGFGGTGWSRLRIGTVGGHLWIR
jgi:hypothetical protein